MLNTQALAAIFVVSLELCYHISCTLSPESPAGGGEAFLHLPHTIFYQLRSSLSANLKSSKRKKQLAVLQILSTQIWHVPSLAVFEMNGDDSWLQATKVYTFKSVSDVTGMWINGTGTSRRTVWWRRRRIHLISECAWSVNQHQSLHELVPNGSRKRESL